MPVSMFEFVSQAKLPTRFGDFTIHGFVDTRNQQEHVALSYGEWSIDDTVHIRVHSECLTGDALFSTRCDCGFQLEKALANLDRLDAVGFTEHYAQSIAYFGEQFGWKNTLVEHHNSGGKKKEIASREIWESMNQYDLPLYDKAIERFAGILKEYQGRAPRVPKPPLLKRVKGYLRALSSKF